MFNIPPSAPVYSPYTEPGWNVALISEKKSYQSYFAIKYSAFFSEQIKRA